MAFICFSPCHLQLWCYLHSLFIAFYVLLFTWLCLQVWNMCCLITMLDFVNQLLVISIYLAWYYFYYLQLLPSLAFPNSVINCGNLELHLIFVLNYQVKELGNLVFVEEVSTWFSIYLRQWLSLYHGSLFRSILSFQFHDRYVLVELISEIWRPFKELNLLIYSCMMTSGFVVHLLWSDRCIVCW